MLNLIKKLFACTGALIACASLVSAETYYLSPEQMNAFGKDLKLSESLSFQKDGSTQYFWYTMGADNVKNWCTSLPDFLDSTSTFKLGYTTNNGNPASGKPQRNLIIDTAFTPGVLENWINGNSISSTTDNFTIDTLKSSAFSALFSGATTVVKIKDTAKGQWNDPFQFGNSTNLIGGLTITGTFNVIASNSYWSCIYASKANSSIDNPDVVINKMMGYSVTREFGMVSYGISSSYAFAGETLNAKSVWQLNAVTTNTGVLVAGKAASTGKLTVVFGTDKEDATTTGSFWQGNFTQTGSVYGLRTDASNNATGAILSIVMKGGKDAGGKYYTQSLTGDYIAFTGGIEMISGNLRINYGVKTKYANYGEFKLSQAAGETTSFGNTGTVGASFAFSNITVNGGGTIVVRMEANSTADDLVYDTITSDGNMTGSGSVVIDLKNYNGNRPDDMLDFMIDHNLTIKVISWSALADSGIEFTTTDDYKTYNFNGQDYVFNAVKGTDGLYINYIPSVPEPAAVATLFGALALAFASLRSAGRRK